MITTIILTALPTLLYTWLLWWLDRYEKEPLPLLLAVFIWGAVPAVAMALLAEIDLQAAVAGFGSGNHSIWLAPLIEEPLKAFALVAIFAFFRYEFDGVLDGIIYGALIGFGFSMSENVLYAYTHPGSGASLLWIRVVLFGFNHAFFTSIVGVTLGMIRYNRRRWVGWASLPGALLLAIFFHALHNAAVGFAFPGILIVWFIDSAGAFIVVLVAVIAWRHERTWIERELSEEITSGLIDAQTYRVVRSSRLRVQAQWRALTSGGWLALRQERELHHLLTELAFLKYQLHIGDCYCRPEDLQPLRQGIAELMHGSPQPSQSSVMS